MSKHTTHDPSQEIPYGYCHCGCGQKTNITTKNDRSQGCIKGQPKQYILGHHNRVMPRTNQAASLKDAFLRHVKESTPIECWEWQGAISAKGYGCLTHNQKRMFAHRASYIIYRGEIPSGSLVCHLCDNRRCCNPHHLWLGSAMDNMQDAIQKGRNRAPSPQHGTTNAQAKLTDEQVRQIRIWYSQGTYSQGKLAKMFGMSVSTIKDIIQRRTWKHIP